MNILKTKFKNLRSDDKQIIGNVFAAFLIKGGALVLALFTLPAYMQYFDDNIVLGSWLTMVAVMSWILNFDLGIGNGLRNKLVKPLIENDQLSIRRYISSAYLSLGFFTFLLAIIGLVTLDFIDWNEFFGVNQNFIASNVLLKTVQIVFLGTLLQFFLRIITSILFAMQKSFVPNLLNLCTTVILLIYIYMGIFVGMDANSAEMNLINLAYANVVAINLPLVIATIIVFKTRLKGFFPRFKYFHLDFAKGVMKLGVVFLWLQLIFMLINNTNEFLITWLIGAESVVEYQVYHKLFTLGGTFIALALTPIWSAVTKAKAQGNYLWIKKLNSILMGLGFIGIALQFLLVPFLQTIVNVWLNDQAIVVNIQYSLFFAISGGLFLWNRIISAMSNGFGELKIQLLFLTFGAIINFPLAILLTNFYESFIAIVIANIISLLPYCIIQPIWMNNHIKKKISNNETLED